MALGSSYLPHGIAVAADGRVFVCDRESDRIQIFSPDGEYLSEWTDVQRPTHLVFDAQAGPTSPNSGGTRATPLRASVPLHRRAMAG